MEHNSSVCEPGELVHQVPGLQPLSNQLYFQFHQNIASKSGHQQISLVWLCMTCTHRHVFWIEPERTHSL